MTLTVNQILPDNMEEFYRMLMDTWSTNLKVAVPGIIQSFNATEQTVTVQPAIQEKILDPKTLETSWVPLPLLVDVPIILPRAGGFILTMPIGAGDECMVIFADACIDGWWANGGAKNTQPDKRRHDLSDGFCLLAPWSQPRVLSNYATDAAQLRTDDGTTYVSVKPGEIDLVAHSVKVNGTPIT